MMGSRPRLIAVTLCCECQESGALRPKSEKSWREGSRPYPVLHLLRSAQKSVFAARGVLTDPIIALRLTDLIRALLHEQAQIWVAGRIEQVSGSDDAYLVVFFPVIQADAQFERNARGKVDDGVRLYLFDKACHLRAIKHVAAHRLRARLRHGQQSCQAYAPARLSRVPARQAQGAKPAPSPPSLPPQIPS